MRWFSVGLLTGVLVVAAYICTYFRDDFDPESIRGKRILVTGASTGIGEQLAYHYARLGARLLITARREHVLREVVKRCRELGSKHGDYHFIAADMSDMTQTKTVIQTAHDKLDGLDILVLNHIGANTVGTWTGSAENLTFFDQTLDVNTKSYVHLASHALPLLQHSAGSIVVLSSGFGKVAPPFGLPYAASKFALDGFFHGLRRELTIRETPVSVTICILGFTATETAMQKLKETGLESRLPPPADPGKAALEVIKSGASRATEVYYPYLETRPLVLCRDWLWFLNERLFARLFRPGIRTL